MILTVATICLGSTRANGGSVATVTDSSNSFSASMRSWSTTARPELLAKWLQRPVNGAVTSMPSPAKALATVAAASSS